MRKIISLAVVALLASFMSAQTIANMKRPECREEICSY